MRTFFEPNDLLFQPSNAVPQDIKIVAKQQKFALRLIL
jgi:hypothetical protein